MAESDIWLKRLARINRATTRWLSMRRKDMAWIWSRRSFERSVPALCRQQHWVFIVGCNNSGTTLIHDVLAETGKFSYMKHEGQVYTDVLKISQRRGHERVWSEYLPDLRLTESDSTSYIGRLMFDWFREMERPLKSSILEKTPANAVRMRWLQRAIPRTSFIGVTRNGYAVVEGIKRKGRKPVRRGARHWQLVNQLMLDESKDIKSFLLMKYEDFVGSPQKYLQVLADFLELDLQELIAAYQRVANTQEIAAIRDMNAESISRLSSKEIDEITAEAGDCLARLGYRNPGAA